MYKEEFIIRTRKYVLSPVEKSQQDWYQNMGISGTKADSLNLHVSLYFSLIISWVCLLYSNSGLFPREIWCVHNESASVIVFSSKSKCNWTLMCGLIPSLWKKGLNQHSVNQVSTPCAFRYGQLCSRSVSTAHLWGVSKKSPLLEKLCLKVSTILALERTFLERMSVSMSCLTSYNRQVAKLATALGLSVSLQSPPPPYFCQIHRWNKYIEVCSSLLILRESVQVEWFTGYR